MMMMRGKEEEEEEIFPLQLFCARYYAKYFTWTISLYILYIKYIFSPSLPSFLSRWGPMQPKLTLNLLYGWDDFEFLILLSSSPKCLDYRCTAQHLSYLMLRIKPRVSRMWHRHSTELHIQLFKSLQQPKDVDNGISFRFKAEETEAQR